MPDSALIVFAREDDYTFGVLHSRFHELWSRATGTQVREAASGFRYTPTTTFETFPFPRASAMQGAAVAEAAADLERLRQGWLRSPDPSSQRTLNALYNDPPTWLTHTHGRLNEAVAQAYGWAPDISDTEVLRALLDLNLSDGVGHGLP